LIVVVLSPADAVLAQVPLASKNAIVRFVFEQSTLVHVLAALVALCIGMTAIIVNVINFNFMFLISCCFSK